MHTMMKGARPPLQSRMDFHYDFLLKTLQASPPNQPLKWLTIMEQSYWFQQQQKEITKQRTELSLLDTKRKELHLVEPFLSECAKRLELEQRMKQAVNAERKQLQRELDSVKNKQMGPKWTKALADYQTLQVIGREQQQIQHHLNDLEGHQYSIQPIVTFLYEMGYLRHADPLTLTNEDLGQKGILATEVNEGHPILMTELYVEGLLHGLSGKELACVLTCFQEAKETEDATSVSELRVSAAVISALKQIQDMAHTFEELEHRVSQPVEGYWSLSTQMVEPMWRWMEGEHASVICAEYNLFEGNFIRTVMKTANMLEEWLSMATYSQHTDQINKITEARALIIRDLVVSDSLYLRLN
jgi:superfamily II RNA helicase